MAWTLFWTGVSLVGMCLTLAGAWIAARGAMLTDDEIAARIKAGWDDGEWSQNPKTDPKFAELKRTAAETSKGLYYVVGGTALQIVGAVALLFTIAPH